jgi:hypothetical protein
MSVPSSSATTFILKSAYPSRYSVRPSSCLQIPHHRYPMTCALPPRIKQVGILGDVPKTPLSTRYLKNSRQPVDDWERRVWRVYINLFLALLFSPSFLQHNSLLFCPNPVTISPWISSPWVSLLNLPIPSPWETKIGG